MCLSRGQIPREPPVTCTNISVLDATAVVHCFIVIRTFAAMVMGVRMSYCPTMAIQNRNKKEVKGIQETLPSFSFNLIQRYIASSIG